MKGPVVFLVFLSSLICVYGSDVMSAKIESHNVEFKAKPGAPPVLHMLDGGGETLETIEMSKMSREDLNELLLNRGFYKRASKEESVPEEYLSGPYVPRDTTKNEL